MKLFLNLASLWMLILFFSGRAFGDRQDLQKQEIIAFQLQVQLDSLEAVCAKLSIQAESLAKQIDINRRKDLLNSSEHRILEKQLQQSQILEDKVQEIESQEKSIWSQYRPILEKLIPFYEMEIEDLVRRMEKEKSPLDREALLGSFKDILRKKQNCEAKLSEPMEDSRAGIELSIKPMDTPRDLLMKGDLLLDQEDALRKEIRSVEERLLSLRKEEKVRKKAEELVLSMRMFNENEELIGRETQIVDKSTFTLEGTQKLDRGPDGTGVPIPRESFGTEEPAKQNFTESPGNPAYRSLSDLQEYIEQLQQLRNQLKIKADLLRDQAHRFHETAEERRK